jgi:GNAT superfamily N-acetyltransferase
MRLATMSKNDLLPSGGLVRKLWVGETKLYRDHLLRLDPASRRDRFGQAATDDFVRQYVASLGSDAIIHGFFIDGLLRGAAELRPLAPSLAKRADAALSVERSWQSHGVGSALLERLLLTARNRRIRWLHMACLAHNLRMQQLARKFDADLSLDFDSAVGTVQAPRPTPLSVMREVVADGHAVAAAMIEMQSSFIPPA